MEYSLEQAVTIDIEAAYRLDGPHPNPFCEAATPGFAVREEQPVTVALYNGLGQRVQVLYDGVAPAVQKQTVRLDARALASGVYFVRLAATSARRRRRRWCAEKESAQGKQQVAACRFGGAWPLLLLRPGIALAPSRSICARDLSIRAALRLARLANPLR